MSSNPLFSRRSVMRTAFAVGASAAVVGGSTLLTGKLAFAADEFPEPRIYSTEEWGAKRPTGPIEVLDYRPSYQLLHHTVFPNTDDFSLEQAFAHARAVQGGQQGQDPPMPDTGYHFLVSRGGYITEGRHGSLDAIRDGTSFVLGAHGGADANLESLGIGLEGDYSQSDASVPEGQWEGLVDLLAYACSQYEAPPEEIYGHRDKGSPGIACPGDIVHDRLDELREAVEARLNG